MNLQVRKDISLILIQEMRNWFILDLEKYFVKLILFIWSYEGRGDRGVKCAA